MDKMNFLDMVQDCFEGLKTEEEITKRAKEMMALIHQQSELSKGYLKAGIL